MRRIATVSRINKIQHEATMQHHSTSWTKANKENSTRGVVANRQARLKPQAIQQSRILQSQQARRQTSHEDDANNRRQRTSPTQTTEWNNKRTKTTTEPTKMSHEDVVQTTKPSNRDCNKSQDECRLHEATDLQPRKLVSPTPPRVTSGHFYIFPASHR